MRLLLLLCWAALAGPLDSLTELGKAKVRDQAWKQAVEEQAIRYMADAKQEGFDPALSAQALVEKFPHLKLSRPFLDHRANMGFSGLKKCYLTSAAKGCRKRVMTFLKGDPTNEALALKGGILIARFEHDSYAMEAFAMAGERACGKDRVKAAVRKTLPLGKEKAALTARAIASRCEFTFPPPPTPSPLVPEPPASSPAP